MMITFLNEHQNNVLLVKSIFEILKIYTTIETNFIEVIEIHLSICVKLYCIFLVHMLKK